MSFIQIVSYPFEFFISFISTLEAVSLFYMIMAALVLCSISMIISKVMRSF